MNSIQKLEYRYSEWAAKTGRIVLAIVLGAVSAIALAQEAKVPGNMVLTTEQARAIVAPLYDALNTPIKKDVVALLAKATNADYNSCSTNQECLNRDQLAVQFKAFGAIIPDLQWEVREILVAGNNIVVRGEASGTPIAPLFGVQPTGRSFRTISLDMFTVVDGKLSTAYHVENWIAAINQVRQP